MTLTQLAQKHNLEPESARVFNMDPNLNKAAGKTFCAMCCRTLNTKTKFSVWSSNFIEAVHPEDVDIINRINASGPCTLVPIGNECARKIPPEFLVLN